MTIEAVSERILELLSTIHSLPVRRRKVVFLELMRLWIKDFGDNLKRDFWSVVRMNCEDTGLTLKDASELLRLALTGRTVGFDLADVADILGPQACCNRLQRTITLAKSL